MNKLFTKIVGAALGLTMAVGVGVAVASGGKNPEPVNAGSATYTEKAGTSLAAGDEVLIVASPSSGTTKYYVPVSTSYTGSAISNSSTVTSVNSIDDSHLWTVEKNSTSYAFKFTSGNSTYYLTVSGSGTGNKTRISTTATYKNWNITSATNGYSMQNATTNSYFGVYTSGSDWRVYASATQSNFGGTGVGIRFYTKDSTKTLSNISVSTAPTKTTYYAGDYFDPTGLVITRTYSDSTSDTYAYAGHTSEFTFTPSTSTALTQGLSSVSISYGGKSTSQAITVNAARTLSSISISGYTTTFDQGDEFDFGGTVTASYSSGPSADVTASATFSGYNMATSGSQTVTVSYTEGGVTKTATYGITVNKVSTITFIAGTDTGGTSVTKGGITITTSTMSRSDNYRVYAGADISFESTVGNIAKIEFTGVSGNPASNLSLKSGSTGSYATSGNNGTWTGDASSVTFTAGLQARLTQIAVTLASTDPVVELSGDSATSVDMLDGDTDSTVKVLAKNIDDYTAWALTFDEDGDEGLTSSDYVTVVPGAFSNNVSTFAITAKKVGSTVLNIQLDGTDCEDTVEITISQKPASITITHADVYEKDNKLQLDLKAGGSYKQMTFSGEDIRGNTYAVAAADVTPSIQSGSSYVTVSGSRITPTSTAGTAVLRYTLNALTSIYIDLTVNVIADRNVSVTSITYVASASGVQGDPLEVSDIISATSTTTLFGETGTIADGEYLFAYSNNRSIAVELGNFVYEITDDTLDAGEFENREIFVFVSFDESYVSSTHVDIEVADRPLTAISLDTGASLNINRNTSHQLEVSYTPYNTTSTRAVTYAITASSSESSITVSNSGLISAGSKIGSTATIKVTSQFSVDIYASVNVTVTREAMTITYDIPEEWVETDASDLAVGDQVILTGVKNSVTYAAGTYSGSGNNVPADTTNTLTVSGTKVTGVVSTMIYTLEEGTVDGSVAFKDSSGKYLYAASSSSNYMKSQDEIDGNASFVLNSDGTVVAQGTSTHNYMRYNNSSTSNLFSCYASTGTTGTLVQFYKLTGGSDTITVGDDLFNDLMDYYYSGDFFECDPDGATFDGDGWNDVGEVLADYKDTYKLNYARANASGNEVEQFLATYDYVVAKHGASYDYLGRIASGKVTEASGIAILGNIINNSSTVSIIVVVSLVSLTAIGGYFFIAKKRKEQ